MNESQNHEKRVAITRWADRYTTRVDQTLNASWPDLVDRLQEAIGKLSWWDLSVGPGKEFKEQHIKPAVQHWVERHVSPLVAEAFKEFRELSSWAPEQVQGDPAVDAQTGSVLEVVDVLKMLTGPGGVLVASSALYMAIVSTTSWLVVTTVAINWPLLITGLVVGALLSTFGIYTTAQLRTTLEDRFRKGLLLPIQDAVIGDGVQREGQNIPSLRCQLIKSIEKTAAAACQHLDEKG